MEKTIILMQIERADEVIGYVVTETRNLFDVPIGKQIDTEYLQRFVDAGDVNIIINERQVLDRTRS